MDMMAEFPNVAAKVSGLYTSSDPSITSVAYVIRRVGNLIICLYYATSLQATNRREGRKAK